jgi:uncharacterized integral membrane protein (TIGR00697 family)
MKRENTHKYLLALAMFYMTIKITTVLLIYKIVTIGGFAVSASTIVIPLWFITGDIIAEIYGYKIARNLVWVAIFCQFIFAFICGSFASVISPEVLENQKAYQEILSRLPRVAFASFFAIIIGGLVNAYAINHWRILLKGKYFALRSIAASSIGELIFTICAYLAEFTGLTPMSKILELMITSYLIKLAVNFMLVMPASFIVKAIKYRNNLSHSATNQSNLFNYLTEENFKTHKIYELYTGNDNKSYFKEIVINPSIKHPLGLYSEKFKVSGLIFREFQPNMSFNWHNAPEEQYIIYLEGNVLVQASGGETKIFKAGDILLAKDLSGDGHITKTLTCGRSIVVTLN